MSKRTRTLLIVLALGPPLLAFALFPLARWRYLDWRPGHEAELAWKRSNGESPPLIDQWGVVAFTDWLVPDWRQFDEPTN